MNFQITKRKIVPALFMTLLFSIQASKKYFASIATNFTERELLTKFIPEKVSHAVLPDKINLSISHILTAPTQLILINCQISHDCNAMVPEEGNFPV